MADGRGLSGEHRYRFRTVKPGAYPTGPSTCRTPHIHFEVTSSFQRRATQMYFPGEALNASDELFSILAREGGESSVLARAVTLPRDDPDATAFEWDLVIAG